MAQQRNIVREGVVRGEDGYLVIPATQRPDGTWRPSRRVKEGYIPPEEMPLYRSRGVECREKEAAYVIPGLTKEAADAIRLSQNKQQPSSKKKKKKINKKIVSLDDNTADGLEEKIGAIKLQGEEESLNEILSSEEIQKKIKGLKKKLQQIKDLEEKISSGELKSPEKDQLEKVKRKDFVSKELTDYESMLKESS